MTNYLTAQQVADMLQVNERTVTRWASQDPSMPVTRSGRVIRFEEARSSGGWRGNARGQRKAQRKLPTVRRKCSRSKQQPAVY